MKKEGTKVLTLMVLSFLLIPFFNSDIRIRYRCRNCSVGSSLSLEVGSTAPFVWKKMRILKGEERNMLISNIMKTNDYKMVALSLEKLGLEPLFEEAWAVEVLEARDAILTRTLGVSVEFLRKSDGFSLIAIFVLEPYAKSLVYRFNKETNMLNLVSGTIGGKNIILPSEGQTLSSCPPCEVLVSECVSIDLACVLLQCYDCYDVCEIPTPVCVGCIIFWCGFGSLYLCCNSQLVCKPCDPASCYYAECMGCPGCGG